MLPFLNVFFFVFHTLFMAFNCLGWIWRRTRMWHLATVTLTALSWFGMGYWYGWGYCFCTDWHCRVRKQLGYTYDRSYTHLLIFGITGIDLSPTVVDTVTAGIFALVFVLSIVLSLRDFLRWRKARRAREGGEAID